MKVDYFYPIITLFINIHLHLWFQVIHQWDSYIYPFQSIHHSVKTNLHTLSSNHQSIHYLHCFLNRLQQGITWVILNCSSLSVKLTCFYSSFIAFQPLVCYMDLALFKNWCLLIVLVTVFGSYCIFEAQLSLVWLLVCTSVGTNQQLIYCLFKVAFLSI